MLVAAAAKKWGVSSDEIVVSSGVVSHGSKQASFGDLAEEATKMPVPDPSTVPLKSPEDFTLIGRTKLSRKDTGKNNGTAIFTQDFKLPDMQTAMVLHAPKFGATLGFGRY